MTLIQRMALDYLKTQHSVISKRKQYLELKPWFNLTSRDQQKS